MSAAAPRPATGGRPPVTARTPSHWHLVCRVVDNFGDAGVLWRLARQLAGEHRLQVRLFIDQPEVLARLVPSAAPGTTVAGVAIERLDDDAADGPVAEALGDADVVLVGFHARLPAAARARLARSPRPVLLLEHLTAESWAADWHGLPSPGTDGVVEHFYYPGFVAASGGLLREAGLFERRRAFDAAAATHRLAALGIVRAPGERLATLLCYPDAPLGWLADRLAYGPHRLRLLASPTVMPDAAACAALTRRSSDRLQITPIPFVPQCDYDTLLWSCDLNFVRGEDSWLRGLWSGRPFLWQAYRQADEAHRAKVDAFLARVGPAPGLAAWATATRAWNGDVAALAPDAADPIGAVLSEPSATGAALAAVVDGWLAEPGNAADLATRLVAFASAKAAPEAL